MLQKISYLNLMLAIAYILFFFRDNTLNFTMGILMIVIFNWLALRSYQINDYKWSFWHYLAGLWSIYYILSLLYGAVNVLSSSIEYQFASNHTLTFLVLSFTFSLLVLFQGIIYFLSNLKEYRSS